MTFLEMANDCAKKAKTFSGQFRWLARITGIIAIGMGIIAILAVCYQTWGVLIISLMFALLFGAQSIGNYREAARSFQRWMELRQERLDLHARFKEYE